MTKEDESSNMQQFNLNILKCRDDHKPILLKSTAEDHGGFKLSDGSHCSWVRPDNVIGPDKLTRTH